MGIVSLKIINKFRLRSGEYNADAYTKNQIYLHHTVGGSVLSTIGWWNSNGAKIGVAFLVDRNGDIYEVFNPNYWAHHLGLKYKYNTLLNKSSIGIELCSEGALREGHELNEILNNAGAKSKFSEDSLYAFDIIPDKTKHVSMWFSGAKRLYDLNNANDGFVHYPKGFRGYKYFDAYNPQQIESTIDLVNYLCELYNIPHTLISDDGVSFQGDLDKVLKFRGILTHANVRFDKSDLHPGFPWDRLKQESKS